MWTRYASLMRSTAAALALGATLAGGLSLPANAGNYPDYYPGPAYGHPHDWNHPPGWGHPGRGYYYPAPRVIYRPVPARPYYPAPAYYYAPPPVYVAPAPVYAPPPVYVPPSLNIVVPLRF
jgi:hypothetical protein